MKKRRKTVKQKALHKTEAQQTVTDLFVFLQDKPTAYMRELYYFAYATRKPAAKEIHQWLKKQGVGISMTRKLSMRLKNDVKKLAKRVYHAIR